MSSRSLQLARTILGVILACVAALHVSCSREVNETKNTPVVSGPSGTSFPMPPISGKSLGELGWQLDDGQRRLVSQYNGDVLILDFYATWCQPCRESIPQLVALQQRYGDRGLRVVGLNVGGPDDRSQVADFARELEIQYTLAIPDPELTNLLLGDSQEIPQTFIFDRHQNLITRIIGFGDGDDVQISAVVESLINRK
jgi:thiol-disulfide isomerase/thioredoxin